jgi:hypothetical protein
VRERVLADKDLYVRHVIATSHTFVIGGNRHGMTEELSPKSAMIRVTVSESLYATEDALQVEAIKITFSMLTL